MPARPRLFLSITTSTLMLCQPLCAFQTTLSDTAVREAYFLGQRHDQKTSDFLKLYAHAFPLPEKGPYISEIHLLSPYAQVVSNSSQHSTGYSAQQAAADYRSRGDTLLVKVRIEFPNAGFELKPQMFANVQLNINYGKQVLVPQEAVMDSGDKQYVFLVHDGGVFEPRTVQLGAKFEGGVVVLSGLKAGETIVTSGNFLIDSESRLKSAMGGMKH